MRTFLRKHVRTLLLVSLVAVTAWLAWKWQAAQGPQIYSVPIVAPGAELVIFGQGFGPQPGAGRLELLDSSGNAAPLQPTAWSDTQIHARLPQEHSGAVRVTQNFFGQPRADQRGFTVQAAGLPSSPYGYAVPSQAASPWPTFRRDARNSGRNPLNGAYSGDKPWFFQTGKGVFSTPVIDEQGLIYVGSADHNFYVLNPDGTLYWKYETGEIIDSAGALGRFDPALGDAPVTFISGDGHMYQFHTGPGYPDPAQRQIWAYEAEMRPGVSYNRWFEGNVAIGADGALYAGNTNFNYYAINPDGTLRWTYATRSNNWSQAAFDEHDGRIFWGSNDTRVRSVDPAGQELWSRMTLGFIAASAAVGSDGTVYIGSFDSQLYALDPQTGAVRWKFPADEHIYSSAALGQNAAGQTTAIYFGSADGNLYALRPDGTLLWRYDAGDPIRSSPVIGLSPEGQEIVYFGAGNGRLYALQAADGRLRWAYDTTPADPELRDRNDLNGSPALGQTGIYIGGEHGQVWYMPYDYCLHQTDPRCQKDEPAHPDGAALLYVTPGGSTQPEFPASLPAAAQITLRLSVRQNGETVDARLCNTPRLLFGLVGCPADALTVQATPEFPMQVEHSADGKYIYIRPQGFLQPGQAYQLKVSGRYDTGGRRLGNLRLGGTPAGQFDQTFSFQVEPSAGTDFPLQAGPGPLRGLEWTRLALPLPPMLPSLNQIGFDYIDWIMAPVEISQPSVDGEGRFVLWAVGAQRAADGTLQADPKTPFILALNGRYRGQDFILNSQDFSMPVTGIPISFNLFELRGRLSPERIVQPGASAWADTRVMSIPTFGPYLVIAGLANNIYEKLLVAGTYITRPYDGPAVQPPQAVSVENIQLQAPGPKTDGAVQASFKLAPGAALPASEHLPGILLIDAATGEALTLNYHDLLSSQASPDGNLQLVRLRLPAGVQLPAQLRAYIMLDAYPLASQELAVK